MRLSARSSSAGQSSSLRFLDGEFGIDDLLDLRQEPGVDLGVAVDSSSVMPMPKASATYHSRSARG